MVFGCMSLSGSSSCIQHVINYSKLGQSMPLKTSAEQEAQRTNLSVAKMIATVNGSEWLGRHASIQKIPSPEALRQQLSFDAQENKENIRDFAGQCHAKNADYGMLKEWPVNYMRGEGSLDGQWLTLSGLCYNDDAMSRIFHSGRPGSKVLDIVEWIKSRALQCRSGADPLEVMPDNSNSFSAFRWMVVFHSVKAV